MKILNTLLLMLCSVAWTHTYAQDQEDQREDLQASAGEASLASYTTIDDTCNHPVLASAASFVSNFFCQNVLKVAVEDIQCEGLLFEVIDAKAQIVSGANFQQKVVLVDQVGDCVIAFKSKVFMPMPHTGKEPEVDMEELFAISCDDVKYDQECLKSLTIIDAYWEEEIENGGGAEPITTLEEEEEVEEEEEEMIETVEEDLAEEKGYEMPTEGETLMELPDEGGDLDAVGLGSATETEGLEEDKSGKDKSKTKSKSGEHKSEKTNSSVTAKEVSSPSALDSTAIPTERSSELPTAAPTGSATSESSAYPPTGLPTSSPSTPAVEALEELTPPGPIVGDGLSSFFGTESEKSAPADPIVDAGLSSLIGLETNTTGGEEVDATVAAELEALLGLETELAEEVSAFEQEVEAEEELQEKQTAIYEDEEELYEDESTWAFAGKTDECSRFGVSPAEGIAFKCDKTVYICGETATFREKFLLLLQDPMVDGCDLGGVTEIFSSRGDCNFFPKNEHYLKRDGTQKDGHHLFCPNGSTLDSYYMFCTEELDNYYCDGSDCETCAGTSRRFLRH